jgi:hypothetical protein
MKVPKVAPLSVVSLAISSLSCIVGLGSSSFLFACGAIIVPSTTSRALNYFPPKLFVPPCPHPLEYHKIKFHWDQFGWILPFVEVGLQGATIFP